jgi:hypothetical protein
MFRKIAEIGDAACDRGGWVWCSAPASRVQAADMVPRGW